MLPVDLASQAAPGYTEDQRSVAGGFIADPGRSGHLGYLSLTRRLRPAGAWTRTCAQRPSPWICARRVTTLSVPGCSPPLFVRRPWLPPVLVQHCAFSGWILDPDRKKMSKSRATLWSNEVLEKYGSGRVRYWAASAHLGADTAYDGGQIKIGRRLGSAAERIQVRC